MRRRETHPRTSSVTKSQHRPELNTSQFRRYLKPPRLPLKVALLVPCGEANAALGGIEETGHGPAGVKSATRVASHLLAAGSPAGISNKDGARVNALSLLEAAQGRTLR
mmetsp:Transcript_74768/g.134721  ORF Transcript_74768/g.134721 Transcript_74768/m.134721 type:complete len:109 (+) Transcript_74768:77-403(+)